MLSPLKVENQTKRDSHTLRLCNLALVLWLIICVLEQRCPFKMRFVAFSTRRRNKFKNRKKNKCCHFMKLSRTFPFYPVSLFNPKTLLQCVYIYANHIPQPWVLLSI